MFTSYASLMSLPVKTKVDPKDIPPPTPVTLPRFQTFAQDDGPVDPSETLAHLLTHIGRPTAALGSVGLRAIGLDLALDAKAQDLIPDLDYIPEFAQWDRYNADEVRDQNQATRTPLRNGNQSPGCQVYAERKKELSHANEDAFRTVRRVKPPKGKQQARLGNAYEFFRCLEAFTAFWDDPTQPPQLPPSPEAAAPEDAVGKPSNEAPAEEDDYAVVRTMSGQSMPAEYRHNLLTAFVKLIAYDFGCNVSLARVEPRLHLSSPEGSAIRRKTYSPSSCSFVFQSPTTREAARAGVVYGPVAAVSARGVVSMDTPDVETAQSADLAREVIAALITAQHRAREGKTETRFGEGEWWTSKPRWGGGTGGPIGREVDKDGVQGDKDDKATDADGLPTPVVKKARKTMSIYDNYRMVRPPSSSWDKKAQYEAIGKQKGADHDDIFVISSLFHHISVLRVRVPQRLLDVLDGAPEPDTTKRSWGKVQAWRSPWYDLFSINDRLEAMQLIWAMMAYQMRKPAPDCDVSMADA